MKKTDCDTKFEVLAEGKFRERQEIETKKYTVVTPNGDKNPEFGFITGFQNIKLEDGAILKGLNLTLFFSK